MLKQFLVTIFCLVAIAGQAFGATSGKIAGRIVDKDSSEPLVGVNITLQGTSLGAATSITGEYFIISVPAGMYDMQVSIIGYQTITVEGVLVIVDHTRRQDFSLSTEAVAGEEVVVTAERPLVQMDRTGSMALVTADEIASLPVRGIADIISLQAGVVEWEETGERKTAFVFRGGRSNEVAYIIDGITQNDPLSGEATTTLNNNAIEEVIILNGGFNAEYGKYMSGIVNVITKSGTGRYLGALEVETDRPSGSISGTENYGYNVWSASTGGPLPGNKVRYFASTEIREIADKFPGVFENGPRPENSDGDFSNGWTGFSTQAKVTIEPTKSIRIDLNSIVTDDTRRDYFESYQFNLDHMQRREDLNRNFSGKITGIINERNFFEARLGYFYTKHEEGDNTQWDDFPSILGTDAGTFVFNGVERTGRFDPFFLFFSPGASWDDFSRSESSFWTGKVDFTSQIDNQNQIKVGFEVVRHSLRHFQEYAPVGGPNVVNSYGYSFDPNQAGPFRKDDDFNNGLDGVKNPISYAGYIQDKLEYQGLIVNAGIRFDFLDSQTDALLNLNDPTGSGVPGNPASTIDPQDLGDNRTFFRVSPRLGISFPMSDRTVMHFNYGKFFQQPNLGDLYVGTIFLERLARGRIQRAIQVPQPNIKPEENTSYEIGIQHQLNNNSAFSVTGYYRDIKNLVDIELVPNTGVGGSALQLLSNLDYGTVKGFDISYELRRTNRMTMRLNYGLAFAVGTGSQFDSNFNNTWLGFDTAKEVAPLDFDQRHTISSAFDFRSSRNDGPVWGNSHPFSNININVLFRVRSGLPYTPDIIYNSRNLASVPGDFPVGGTNSQYAPWTLRLDLKASKSIYMGNDFKIMPYVRVINLLDRSNAVRVYSATGSSVSDGFLESRQGQFLVATQGTSAANFGGSEEFVSRYRNRLEDSLRFGQPRQIRFGLLLDF